MAPTTPEKVDFRQAYDRSNYRIVGKHKHSALKPCHWMLEKLFTGRDLPLSDPSNRNCYKGYFGIKSEKCIQNTPALPFCTHNCIFCWRDIEEGNLGPRFTLPADEPKYLVRELIRNQLNMLDHHLGKDKFLHNYDIMASIISSMKQKGNEININDFQLESGESRNRIEDAIVLLKTTEIVDTRDSIRYTFNPRVDSSLDPDALIGRYLTTKAEISRAFESAHEPSHAAISLAGEPTLYPHVSGLVGEFKRRGFTTFIVSNGTTPDVLQRMDPLPTQLYITLPPPNEKLYTRIHRPAINGGYQAIMKTLELLPSLSCRTCLRITHVKGINDSTSNEDVQGIIKLVNVAMPHFLEIKGVAIEARAMLMTKRLGMGGDGSKISESAGFAPTFEDVMAFARRISEASGFPIVETSKPSRDVLMLVNWTEGTSIRIARP
ncbi:MAG: radical SAM protein [Candidatus Lokiarchaeota archaeon]|nr:radical SAM protein [Candidatus Lokiarchaeota archaeon]